jgi:isopentenyl-diphosphate delta-isomerase
MTDETFERRRSGAEFTADSDALILVDEQDRQLGNLNKALCHEGRGILHRAFSLLIFNSKGQLLLQQRARTKRLWPGYWSNSCCSHPRWGESLESATARRLHEELGLRCELQFLFKFQYQAQFDATGAENELCSVYAGRCNQPPRINREEIMDWRWVDPEQLQAEIDGPAAGRFTPWFVLEWARIRAHHRAAILALPG